MMSEITMRRAAFRRRFIISDRFAVAIVFVVAFLFYLPFQMKQSFADPDSFYHAKTALLIREQGFPKQFPWLRFTVLADPFVDHHLGYHLLLIPFVTIFPPLFGMKAAALLLAAGAVAAFYFLLRKLRINAALFWTVILATTQPFIFRVNIARAPALAEIFLFLGLLALFERRLRLLFVITLLFVWSYNAWPVLFVALFAVTVGELLTVLGGGRRGVAADALRQFLRPLGVMSAAAAAGLVVNPYFPENLAFSWLHIVGIGLRNYQNTIGVGAEWYPYALVDLLKDAPLPFLALVFSGTLFAIGLRAREVNGAGLEKRFAQIFTALILAGAFFILTLKSRRNVEFLIPSMTLLSGLLFSLVSGERSLRVAQEALRRTPLLLAGAISFVVLLAVVGGQGIAAARRDLVGGYPWSRYELVSGYLRVTLPPGATVVTSDWDDFPPLFYRNDRSTYVLGLDPTYMYLYDRDLYRVWVDLTQGRVSGDLVSVLRDRFHAGAVMVDNDHGAMRKLFESDRRFERWYQDEEATVYGVGNPPSAYSLAPSAVL